MSAQPIPTPRTDAELARVLTDGDLTNIDRREAMADFARLLEVELAKLAKDASEFLRASGGGDKLAALYLENRDLRRTVEAREKEIELLREFLRATADLMTEAARKAPDNSK